MRKKNLSLFLVFSVLAWATGLVFAGAGVTGMDFVKLKSAARPLGMGNAFVGVADDVSSLSWNVGGLANLSGQEMLFTHFTYLDGIGYNNLAYVMGGEFGAVGVGFTNLSLTGDEMNIQYKPGGTIAMKNQIFSFAYSRKFRKLFTYGCGVNIFNSVIGEYSALAYGVNFGGLCFAPLGFVIGFAAQNLGPKYEYKTEGFTGEKQPLPSTYIVGLAKKLKLPGGNLVGSFDLLFDYMLRENVGIEYKLFKMLAFRAGYKLGYDSGGFTLGLGIDYKPKGLDRFCFDYAFSPVGDFGNSHCFSVIAKF